MALPPRIDKGTWIVLADGEKALFLENAGTARTYDFRVRRIEEQDNPPNRDQATGRPGRMSDGPSGHKSAVEETDWHQIGKERFARSVAAILSRAAQEQRYQTLVLVAAPQVLGEMRSHLHADAQSRILHEIPKTLTNHSLEAVERIVRTEAGAF